MGWDFQHRRKGERTEDLLAAMLGDGRNGGKGLVASRSVGSTFYVAYRTKLGNILGVVALTRYHSNDYYNWGVKFISESEGPCESACPKAILGMLTPIEQFLATDDMTERQAEYASKWRARCAKSGAPIKVGTVLSFETPLNYGTTGQVRHIVVTNPRRRIGRPYTPPTPENQAVLGVPEQGLIGNVAIRIPVWFRSVPFEITGQIDVPDWATGLYRYN